MSTVVLLFNLVRKYCLSIILLYLQRCLVNPIIILVSLFTLIDS
jgi:hypothetical protein